MFIIAYQPLNEPFPLWYVVQALPEQTEPAHVRKGTYRVWFQIRHANDAKKLPVAHCRYWPEIHKFDEKKSIFGDIIMVNPHKAVEYSSRPDRHAYELDINLIKYGIIGPFDLYNRNPKARKPQPHYVPDAAWKALEERATQFTVDVTELRKVVPLYFSKVRFTNESVPCPYRDRFP